MNNRRRSIPFGILLIASFYAFGAIILLAFLVINPGQAASVIAQRHGLPASTGNWILPIVAGLGLLVSFGLYSLSKWGYALTLLYLIYFGSVNWFMYRTQADLLFFGNLVWSFLVILYLVLVRKRFFGNDSTGHLQSKSEPGQR